MLYVLWAIVFIAAFLYFVYLVIVGGKLVKQKLGLLAGIVFVGGIISFAGGSAHKQQYRNTINGIEKWTFASEDTLEKGMRWTNWISVDNNLLHKYNLTYTCGLGKQRHKHVPISASMTTPGWTIGTTWEPDWVELETTVDNEHVKYTITGVVKWHLLGFTVYRQSKTYIGLAPVINHY